MLDPLPISPEQRRPLKRTEFERLVELGAFQDERVELLYGTLVRMSPQGTRHAELTTRVSRSLDRQLGDRAVVRTQAPLATDEYALPEPDVAVVPPRSYMAEHPRSAILVVEVADSSLRDDRLVKSGLYAAAGIPEYWLVDLTAEAIEVRTQPEDGVYRQLRTLKRGESLQPLAFPDVEVRLDDLFAA